MEKLIYRYAPLPKLKIHAGKILAATDHDKKNVGGVRRFVLPVGIGDAGVVEDVTPAELEAAVKYMLVRARTEGRGQGLGTTGLRNGGRFFSRVCNMGRHPGRSKSVENMS
jgi:hypothetical protein